MKISPADTVAKNKIAGKKDTGGVKADTTGGVAGGADNFKLVSTKFDSLVIFEKLIRGKSGVSFGASKIMSGLAGAFE